MPATSVDAENALAEIAREIAHLRTGFERVMAMIAIGVDAAPVSHADGWHRSLLQRLAHPFPGVREAVISRSCYNRLDRLRAVRHRERNTYGLDLDLEIVLERSGEAVDAFAVFRTEILAFLHGFTAAVAMPGSGQDKNSTP